jgi:GTP 3',8-cyclase
LENLQEQLIDLHNRRLNYLRISITDRCNLKCIYCSPQGDIAKLTHSDILTYEEILRLAAIAIDLGVSKIRLTGGEPLVRKGVFEFIPKLAKLPGLEDLSLTTNGIYLKDNIERIRSGGIRRINVSLDTLNREKYKRITGFDGFMIVWEALRLALKSGFSPIKVNVVPIKGINDDELLDFARLSLHYPFHIRFIEEMPIGPAGADPNLGFVPNDLIKNEISQVGKLIRVIKTDYDGPAERFKFAGAPGEIGFISPRTEHFCHTCNRLRLTAAGHLRVCLLSDQEIDIKGPMRGGASDNALKQIFLEAARKKPLQHSLNCGNDSFSSGEMSSIGG